jgi:uncharacterized protein (TIGR02246 family)
MAEVGELLQRLVDIEEIKQLKARYFRFLDTKNWEAFANLFTAGASMEADGHVEKGRDAIVAFLPTVLEGVVTTHHGHTPEITITGSDTATGIWAMFDYLTFPGDGLPKSLKGYGHYHEEYVREEGTWRIKRLVLTRLRVDHLQGSASEISGPDTAQ